MSDRTDRCCGVVTLSGRVVAGPVLARVLGALGARAALPVERVSDLLVAADIIARAHDDAAAVRVAFTTDAGNVELVIGPVADDVAQVLLEQPRVSGVALLPRLADAVALEGVSGERTVRLRFA